jgi:hypothetical protein
MNKIDRVLFVIDNCKELLKASKQQFASFIDDMISRVDSIKFIIITNSSNPYEFETDKLSKIKTSSRIDDLDDLSAANLLINELRN